MAEHRAHYNLTGFGFLLSDTSRLLRRRFEQKAHECNLTSAQWRAIAELSRTDGLTQVALAQRLDIEPMTVCRLVDRMEAGGFVRREASPSDKRAKFVYLTDQSKGMLETMKRIAVAVYEEAFEGVSEEERTALVSALKQVNSNLSDKAAVCEEESA